MLLSLVMPGLVPGIHVLGFHESKQVDGRPESGHDAHTMSNDQTTRRSAFGRARLV